MKRIGAITCASFIALAAMVAAPAARAGVDISFGMHAPIGDDGNLFFSISSRYFDRDARVVDDWGRRFPNPDDLAVFLHICAQSHMAPEAIFRYRSQGMPWYDVGVHAGVPVDMWYVPVERDPGPPYGKAYGYWHKHERDPHYNVRLNDKQCRDLVAVRMAHEYYGVAPETAMDWRRNGESVRTIMTREYRTRHHDDDRHEHGNDDRSHDDHHHGNHHNDDRDDHHGRHDDHRDH
jgi:hypothetical protein